MTPRARIALPNYTQAPNVLLDELLPEIDSLGELKVTLVVVRQTIGFHLEEEKLTFSELMRRTGLSRDSVNQGVKRAIARGTIERRKEGVNGAFEAFYALNVTGTESEPVPVQKVDRDRSGDQTASGQDVGPVPIEEKETEKESQKLKEKEDWEKVLEQLADVVPGMTLRSFRESLSITSREGNAIVLQASDDIVAGWARSTFLPQIEAAAARVFGAATVVELPKSETEERREQAAAVRRRRPPQRERKRFLS